MRFFVARFISGLRYETKLVEHSIYRLNALAQEKDVLPWAVF
jgi:hypothetical protein